MLNLRGPGCRPAAGLGLVAALALVSTAVAGGGNGSVVAPLWVSDGLVEIEG